MTSWNKCAVTASAVLVALTLTACGSGSKSDDLDAAAGASVTPPASSPASTGVTVEYTAKETSALNDAAFDAAFKVVTNRTKWAAAPAAVRAQAKAFVASTISTAPAGGRWAVETYVGDYGGKKYVACTSTPEEIVVRVIVPKDGSSIAVSTSTAAGSTFIIYNAAKAGKKPFDKDGYTYFGGACAGVAAPTANAANVVKGTF